MINLDNFIDELKQKNLISENFDQEYEDFKIGYLLKQEREKAGLTQEQIALKLKTNKSNISRIEKHSKNIRLSTLEKYANAVGKKLSISLL
jgi:transcriptional regulator